MLDAPSPEEQLGLAIAAYEKGKHKPALPPSMNFAKPSDFRKKVMAAVTKAPKSTREIWEKVGKDRATVSNYLNEFNAAGLVNKQKFKWEMYWSLK